jgi:hypothetical protein
MRDDKRQVYLRVSWNSDQNLIFSSIDLLSLHSCWKWRTNNKDLVGWSFSFCSRGFICKQVFDINFKGFQIRDDSENTIIDDALTLHIFSMNEGENKIHLYVDDDLTTIPLTLRMPNCY